MFLDYQGCGASSQGAEGKRQEIGLRAACTLPQIMEELLLWNVRLGVRD
jgi:hypothetical protein